MNRFQAGSSWVVFLIIGRMIPVEAETRYTRRQRGQCPPRVRQPERGNGHLNTILTMPVPPVSALNATGERVGD